MRSSRLLCALLITLFAALMPQTTAAQTYLYVADSASNKILRYDTNGNFVDVLIDGSKSGLDVVECLSFGPDKNLYVGSTNTDTISRFDPVSGKLLGIFIPNFDMPRGMSHGSDGNLYVVSGAGVMSRFHGTTGAFLDNVASAYRWYGATRGGVPGPDGHYYIVDVYWPLVRRFGPDHPFLGYLEITWGTGVDNLAFGPDGDLYLTSKGADPDVYRVNPKTGTTIRTYNCAANGPACATFGPDGMMYVGFWDAGVHKFNPDTGEYLGEFVPKGRGGLQAATNMQFISPFGVPAVYPAEGGNAGTVSARIVDPQGIPQGTTVKLVGAGLPDIVGQNTQFPGANYLTTTFDLEGSAVGARDLVLLEPGGGNRLVKNAFLVSPGGVAEPWVEIVGRSNLRTGAESTYSIVYGNRGTVDARGLPIWVGGIAPEATVKLGFEMNPPPTPEGKTPPDWSKVPIWFDSGGRKVFPFLMPNVPAGYNGVLQLKMTLPAAGAFDLTAGVSSPFLTDENSMQDMIRCMVSLIDPLLNLPPMVDCFYGILSFIDAKMQADLKARLRPQDQPDSLLWDKYQLIQQCAGELIPPVAVLELAIDMLTAIYELSEAAKSDECQRTWKRVRATSFRVQVVGAVDPNDITGPKGYGAARWINGTDRVNYLIQMENLPAATAPAATVVIKDKLDPTLFDLGSISLGAIRFGKDRVVTPLPNISPVGAYAQEFLVDLRPEQELLVKIRVELTPAGELTWRFTTLDVTGVPLDPDDPRGFLPPNKNAPEGEGSVLFSILPKAGLPTGTVVPNKASIVFDANAPIETPVWSNTIDNSSPESKVAKLAAVQTASKFTVSWPNATDQGAGIKDYTVFVSTDGGAFLPWLEHTTLTKATFTGVGGHKYAFYSVARDHTGNTEAAPAIADASTTVKLCPDFVRVTPNPVPGSLPATGTVTLTGPAPSGGMTVTLASSNTALATVPTSITVPEGALTQTFTVSTSAVTATNSLVVTATGNGTSKKTTLKVRPIAISSLAFSPATVRSGATTTGAITLEAAAAPGSITVSLTSTVSGLLPVPATVVVPAGGKTAAFNVTAGVASVSTTVKATATAGGITKTASVKVLANGVASLTLNPASVKGGTNVTATITLDAPASANTTVTLSSSAVVTAVFVDGQGNPINSLIIPAGQKSATVTVRTVTVTSKKSVTLKATANGLYKTAVLTVNP